MNHGNDVFHDPSVGLVARHEYLGYHSTSRLTLMQLFVPHQPHRWKTNVDTSCDRWTKSLPHTLPAIPTICSVFLSSSPRHMAGIYARGLFIKKPPFIMLTPIPSSSAILEKAQLSRIFFHLFIATKSTSLISTLR